MLKIINFFKIIFSYKLKLGALAWLLNRITGLGLVFYFFLHLFITRNFSSSKEQFDQTIQILSSPLFKFLEIGLLFIILFHGLNGLRIITMDFIKHSKYQKLIFLLIVILTMILLFFGSIPLVREAIG